MKTRTNEKITQGLAAANGSRRTRIATLHTVVEVLRGLSDAGVEVLTDKAVAGAYSYPATRTAVAAWRVSPDYYALAIKAIKANKGASPTSWLPGSPDRGILSSEDKRAKWLSVRTLGEAVARGYIVLSQDDVDACLPAGTEAELEENVATMLLESIAAGAYYWLRAEGPDENMVSALNRMRYRQMVERLKSLDIPLPTAEEMYAYAADRWPKHKLHAAPTPLGAKDSAGK